MIFLHDKGHQFIQRADRVFGSEYIIFQNPEFQKEIKNGTDYIQVYEVQRTYWEALDSKERRCDEENKHYPTECVTNFLEDSIGCSMGMAESDDKLER